MERAGPEKWSEILSVELNIFFRISASRKWRLTLKVVLILRQRVHFLKHFFECKIFLFLDVSTGVIYRKRIAICRNVVPEILRKVNSFQNFTSFGNFPIVMKRAFSDGKEC